MDFYKYYKELEARQFPIAETSAFTVALGQSDDIASHFEIYCMAMQNLTCLMQHAIGDQFDKHGMAGAAFLVSKLSEREEIAIHAAYLLSTKVKFYIEPLACHGDLVCTLLRFTDSQNVEIRRKSIIILGWVGTEEVLPVLKKHLLTDADGLCRAWSASAFMQLSCRDYIAPDVLKAAARDAITECLHHETDLFVKGVAVETVQEIWMVKLGMRSSAVEARKERSILAATKRALDFLQQYALGTEVSGDV